MLTQHDDPAFAINIDTARRLVEVTPRGLWDLEIATRFMERLVAMLAILPANGCPIGQQVSLIDLGESMVQPPQIAPMLAGLIFDPRLKTRRIALVIQSPLLRMQAKRVVPQLEAFATRDEAIAALLAPDAAAQSA